MNKGNPQQLAAEYELYKRIKLLGEGAFGKAYLVEDLQTHELLVQKQMDMKAMSPEEKKETQKEAKILQQLNHPNIVKFKDVYTTKKGKLCIIMEYADGGDLSKVVKEARGKYLPEKQILDWFTQICLAMKHVHDRKIIHRDLKGQNIFLTKNNLVKLGDFGIAKILSKTLEKAKTMVGTPYYLSPEIIESKPYSSKTDIWSLGVILYELCALKPPFNADSLHFLALKIVKGSYAPIPSHYSREMKNLMSILLQVDPVRRPSINEIMKLPIINERVKNFLSETVRQIEFSHTILHNKDIKMVNNDTPCPPHLLEQMKRQKQEGVYADQTPPQQSKEQQPQKAAVANYHFQQKGGSQPNANPSQVQQIGGNNPVMNYANNYRPPSEGKNLQIQQRPQQVQQVQQQQQQLQFQQQQQQQEQEKRKEAERVRLAQLEREKIQKEKEAVEKLLKEREVRLKRERELKEFQDREQLKKQLREKDEQQQRLEKQQYQSNQIHQQKPPKREELGVGGVGVYGNPNFKPQPMKGVPKSVPLIKERERRPNSGKSGRSGSQSKNDGEKKIVSARKDEDDKQRLQDIKLQRIKIQQERKEQEQKQLREKQEEIEKRKEENQKKFDQNRDLIKKDRERKKWEKGEPKFELVEKQKSQVDYKEYEKETHSEPSSNVKDKLKKWEKKGRNDEWNVEIFESKKRPEKSEQEKPKEKEEELDQYNSEEENQEKRANQNEKQDYEEYNSDEEAQNIRECLVQEESKLETIKEESYLQQKRGDSPTDDTTFNILVDMNDPKYQNWVEDLQEVVGGVAEKIGNIQIEKKYQRNNVFDFTKTMKTQKNVPALPSKDLDEENNIGERDDDPNDEFDHKSTGKFIFDFPEPPVLMPKHINQDEEESINVISSGYGGLEELYIRLESELGPKFMQAYHIMQNELRQTGNLDDLEKKYGQNKYRDILSFLSDVEIKQYLRLIITLIILEEQLLHGNLTE